MTAVQNFFRLMMCITDVSITFVFVSDVSTSSCKVRDIREVTVYSAFIKRELTKDQLSSFDRFPYLVQILVLDTIAYLRIL